MDPITIAAIIGGAAQLGSAALSNADDGGDVSFEYQQLPDYKESEGARGLWWDTLQKWGADPNYGAVTQDWNNIWERAKQKISQYYWGSATAPGLADKMKAGLARRNVSDSPASQLMMARLGAEESGKLSDMTGTMAEQAATLGENARNTWLSSLMGLSQLKPQYMTSVGVTQPSANTNLASGALSLAGTGLNTWAQNKSNNDFWTNLLTSMNKGSAALPQTSQLSLTGNKVSDYGAAIGSNITW